MSMMSLSRRSDTVAFKRQSYINYTLLAMLIYSLKTFQIATHETIPCNDNSECHLNVNYTHEKAKIQAARHGQCSGWATPHYRACRDTVAWAANTVLRHSFARTCSLCCPVLWCNNVSSLSFLNCSTLGNSPALAFKKLLSPPSLYLITFSFKFSSCNFFTS
jgi:hypothetical protein